MEGGTDWQTDEPTNQQTNRVNYKVAFACLKIAKIDEFK
jgi:hypothetical protein